LENATITTTYADKSLFNFLIYTTAGNGDFGNLYLDSKESMFYFTTAPTTSCFYCPDDIADWPFDNSYTNYTYVSSTTIAGVNCDVWQMNPEDSPMTSVVVSTQGDCFPVEIYEAMPNDGTSFTAFTFFNTLDRVVNPDVWDAPTLCPRGTQQECSSVVKRNMPIPKSMTPSFLRQ